MIQGWGVMMILYLVLVHKLVEDLGWPHGSVGLGLVNLVVATNITRRSLAFNQFFHNGLFVVLQGLK